MLSIFMDVICREEDDSEEGVERGEQGDGEGRQHRFGKRPEPDRETPP